MTAKSRTSTYVEGMEGLTIPPPDKPPRRPSASGANAKPLPPSPPHASPKSASTSNIKKLLGREKTNSQDLEKRPIAYVNGGEGDDDDDNDSLLDVDLQVVEEQSQQLTLRLEQDIRGLSRAVSMHEVATRSAQAEAQNYAEKYVKLREEYETYVQRLMVKLTHEQQTRAMLEEKLEDVYVSLLFMFTRLMLTELSCRSVRHDWRMERLQVVVLLLGVEVVPAVDMVERTNDIAGNLLAISRDGLGEGKTQVALLSLANREIVFVCLIVNRIFFVL